MNSTVYSILDKKKTSTFTTIWFQAESSGITTFAVGIGLGIKAEEINLIASYPSSIYAYTLENYDDLAPLLVERFATELCKVPAYVPVTVWQILCCIIFVLVNYFCLKLFKHL